MNLARLHFLKMSTINETTLSISLSRNHLAFAIFRRGQLDFFAGKTLRQYRNAKDRNRGFSSILNQLILTHLASNVVIPSLNKQQRRSSGLCSLYLTVGRFCMRNGLTLRIHDPVEARRQLVGTARPTKVNARGQLVKAFPELLRFAAGDTQWEQRYYGHVFTAIACGLMAAESGGCVNE